MSYPTDLANSLSLGLEQVASKTGSSIFVGRLEIDPRGTDYRCIVVDTTRSDWGKIRGKLNLLGWTSFGSDGIVHTLPGGMFLVARPNF